MEQPAGDVLRPETPPQEPVQPITPAEPIGETGQVGPAGYTPGPVQAIEKPSEFPVVPVIVGLVLVAAAISILS